MHPLMTPATQRIFTALENQVRFVGGCVRNMLLGVPVTDMDMATPFVPQESMARLERQGIKSVPTGIAHGTITAVIDHTGYEITTLRRDVACDGRHAEVSFTDDWQEDAARRDFTINALSLDHAGILYDYFGGKDDIAKHHVRFVGNAQNRCREDILRILRFFRFSAYYGSLPLDEEGLAASALLAEQLPSLSGERISGEMVKLLLAPDPAPMLHIMQEQQITPYLFPAALHPDMLAQLVKIEAAADQPTYTMLRLAALLQGDGASLKACAKRWKFSNKDQDFLHRICTPEHPIRPDAPSHDQHVSIRYFGREVYIARLLLYWAIQPNGANTKNYRTLLEDAQQWDIPVFPLNGKDLQSIGIAPGKRMGELLTLAECWWEEQHYAPSREELLAFVQKQSCT